MKTTRTEFLATVAAGVAAATLVPSRLLDAASAAPAPDARAFPALVGEVFRFDGSGGRAVDLVLAAYAEATPRPGTSQFTLTFAAPGGETVREGTYSVTNARTGTFQMFVVPSGRDERGRPLARADFNLLVEARSAPTTVAPRR